MIENKFYGDEKRGGRKGEVEIEGGGIDKESQKKKEKREREKI